MQTILRLAAFMVASALFAADGEPEPEAESDERSAAALFATHRGYCVSYTEVGNWRRDDARTVYLSGVFHVDVDDWRNVKEDRPSTSREVAMHFELDYAAWLVAGSVGAQDASLAVRRRCRLGAYPR